MAAATAPRRLPIYRATLRPFLTMGGDGVLVPAILASCGFLALITLDPLVMAICAAVGVGSLLGLRIMAKADPLMFDVYRRQVLYAAYYPPRSTPWRVDPAARTG